MLRPPKKFVPTPFEYHQEIEVKIDALTNLGIWGDEATTGKEASDLARHKKTLPVLHAMEQASPADREVLTNLYAEPNPGASSVAAGLQVLERTGSREYTRQQAQEWRSKAISEIRTLAQLNPRAVAKLEEIIDRVISA
jgi:geranylgeranyl diphosphate synthase type I